ncbi:hypothetical protein POJ06DRAFT_244258 [Lipomyces tetrasporus]|uniref:Uncharacterized protein n=1 Tax=Lipomyces tetrasporus TaxID=54092 RepID=A0AAD7VWL8_9ASCO|nr:uncharacterized protein POJ06DRAFT_244258 [Lipomyces tetrasporus]KAJ8104336.1 hypothetical protein POJ06DRAFT_244258 [Lipomyces tetrasporus]
MLSVPSLFPKNSHDIWYTPTYKRHVIRRSTNPKSQFLPGATIQDDEDESIPSSSRPGPHAVPVTALEFAEAELVHNMESIRTFGFTFLRPPGFTKTEQALLEEQELSDSESEDNGLIENPNGELVMMDGAEEEEEIGEEEDEEVEEQDDEDEEDVDEDEVAEEALDGWPRRQRRRRYRVNTLADEVDLDADIPEGDNLGMESDEEDYDEQDEEQEEQEASGEESLEMETPRRQSTSGFAIPSDDDYEMGMEFDDDDD